METEFHLYQTVAISATGAALSHLDGHKRTNEVT